MLTRRLARPFEVKSLTDAGQLSGYGSVFGVEDWYGDTVAPGAFAASLAVRRPLLLWQHDTEEPIGVWNTAREDAKGLYMEGQLALKTQRGAEAYELLKMGALDGLSIGFQTVKSTFDEKTKTRTLLEVDLWETSLVSFPALDPARVAQVKARGCTPDFSEIETVLRDAGLSRRDAKALMADGVKALTLRDAGDGGLDDVIAVALKTLAGVKE